MSLFLGAFLSVVLVVSACSATPNAGANNTAGVAAFSVMGDNIRDILEELRLRMHMDMTEELGIPVLDPFQTELLHVDLDDFGFTDAALTLTDVSVVGGNQFVVNDADFNLIGLKFLIDLTLPELLVTGNFVGFGDLLIISLAGSGPFSLKVFGIHTRAEGQLKFSAANGWEVAQMSIDFSIERMVSDFEGLLKNGDLFNEVMSAVGPEILDENWPVIEPLMVSLAKEMLMEFLNDMTLSELIAKLTGDPADLFPPIQPGNEV